MPPQFATTLCHGLPTTEVAFFADQPAWGRTLAISMGAIADNSSFRQRARELQQMLAGEDGVANVVAEIVARLIKDAIKEWEGATGCASPQVIQAF
jgi:hypothetical protein